MEAEYLDFDREGIAITARERYDEEELELTRLLCQLEAWRDAWRNVRCRPGMRVTEELIRESQRLARSVDAFMK